VGRCRGEDHDAVAIVCGARSYLNEEINAVTKTGVADCRRIQSFKKMFLLYSQ
jgi:hypothetical protein